MANLGPLGPRHKGFGLANTSVASGQRPPSPGGGGGGGGILVQKGRSKHVQTYLSMLKCYSQAIAHIIFQTCIWIAFG